MYSAHEVHFIGDPGFLVQAFTSLPPPPLLPPKWEDPQERQVKGKQYVNFYAIKDEMTRQQAPDRRMGHMGH